MTKPNDSAERREADEWVVSAKQATQLLEDSRPAEALRLLDKQQVKSDYARAEREILRSRALTHLGESSRAEKIIGALLERMASDQFDAEAAKSLEMWARKVKILALQHGNDFDAQERFIKESLERAESARDQADFTMDLAHCKRQSGHLDDAIKLFEDAIELRREHEPEVPPHFFINIAMAMVHRGRLDRAESFLRIAQEGAKSTDCPILHRAYLELTLAFYELQRGRLNECQLALDRARQYIPEKGFRPLVIWSEYQAKIWLLQGRPSKSRELLEPLMQQVKEKEPYSDLFPEVVRSLASVYLVLNNPKEALHYALVATSAGAKSDVLEEIAGLRVAAESHLAVGNLSAARDCLADIQERFGVIEFASEQLVVEETQAEIDRQERIREIEARRSKGLVDLTRLEDQLQEIEAELEATGSSE